jgi:hypothetical protein
MIWSARAGTVGVAARGKGLRKPCVTSSVRPRAATIRRCSKELRNTQCVDPFFLALLLHALGRKEEAFLELERAVDENSAALFIIDVDPRLDPRADPGFGRIRDRVFNESFHPAQDDLKQAIPA